MKEETISLRKEVAQLNKNVKSSQTLVAILSRQRCLHKFGFGYACESSIKNDENANASKYKNMEKIQSCANTPSSNKSK